MPGCAWIFLAVTAPILAADALAGPFANGTGVQVAYTVMPGALVASALSRVLGHAVDYADLYFQASRHESWALEDGMVKEGAHGIEQGVGVRAIAGDRTGFAYSDEISYAALDARVTALAGALRARGAGPSGTTDE